MVSTITTLFLYIQLYFSLAPLFNDAFQVVGELPASGEAPRFDSFNLWGDFAGPDAKFDDRSGMVFQSCENHYNQLVRARGLYCPMGGCKGFSSEGDGSGGSVAGAGVEAVGELGVFPSKGEGDEKGGGVRAAV